MQRRLPVRMPVPDPRSSPFRLEPVQDDWYWAVSTPQNRPRSSMQTNIAVQVISVHLGGGRRTSAIGEAAVRGHLTETSSKARRHTETSCTIHHLRFHFRAKRAARCVTSDERVSRL